MESRIQLLLDDPSEAAHAPWITDPEVFDLFLPRVFALVESNPAAARQHVKTILAHAPTRCQRVLGHGLWAQIHRATDDSEVAARFIAEGFFLGADCEACLAELYRRRAMLRKNQHRFEDALLDVGESIERYLALGHPGHNLHRNGLASAYNVRGGIRYYMDDFAGAIEDFQTTLASLDPTVSPSLYRVAIYNLAAVLQSTGRREDLEEAERYLKKARQLFHGVRKGTQERARLDWLTAQVRYKLGKGRPRRIQKDMERAIEDFNNLSMPLEAAAVGADLMKMRCARERWGGEAHRSLVQRIAQDLPVSKPEIQLAIDAVVAAADECRLDALSRLRAAIDGLREACGGKMMPCLLTWPESDAW